MSKSEYLAKTFEVIRPFIPTILLVGSSVVTGIIIGIKLNGMKITRDGIARDIKIIKVNREKDFDKINFEKSVNGTLESRRLAGVAEHELRKPLNLDSDHYIVSTMNRVGIMLVSDYNFKREMRRGILQKAGLLEEVDKVSRLTNGRILSNDDYVNLTISILDKYPNLVPAHSYQVTNSGFKYENIKDCIR